MSKKEQSVWDVLADQGEIGLQPTHKALSAGEPDRKAIAKLLELVAVDSLTADITLQRVPGNKAVIHVQGMLKANVVQSCVISQAPVKAHIEDEFEGWYADTDSFVSINKARNERSSKSKTHAADNEVQIVDEREDPEPIINGKIDLGDLVVQYLSLALPPYPRAHGVTWDNSDDPEAAPPSGSGRLNPFAALKDWKSSRGEGS